MGRLKLRAMNQWHKNAGWKFAAQTSVDSQELLDFAQIS